MSDKKVEDTSVTTDNDNRSSPKSHKRKPKAVPCHADVNVLLKTYGGRIIKAPKEEVIRPNCAGIDVHKKVLVVAVCITDPDTNTASFHCFRFTTSNEDILEIADLLKQFKIVDVCMESTGKYWIPVFNILESSGLKPVLVHPKYVKQLHGKKTDFTDAIHIASEFRLGKVIASFIPPQDIRDLRELCRYRLKLTYMQTAEKNRFQNSMTVSQIRLDCVLSDPFGKSATDVIRLLLNTPKDKITDDAIMSCINKNVKASREEILESVRGYELSSLQKAKMQVISEDLDNLDKLLAEIDDLLKPYYEKYKTQVDHLCTMIGIQKASALYILAEIGTDMSVWTNAEAFVCWAGFTPGTHNSANTKKNTKAQGDKYLKPLMVQCALAAIKSTSKNPYYRYKYLNIKKRRGHKRAIIAISRMMMIAIYHMLKDDKDFMPSDYTEIISKACVCRVEPTLKNAYKILKDQGLDDQAMNEIRKLVKDARSQKDAKEKEAIAKSASLYELSRKHLNEDDSKDEAAETTKASSSTKKKSVTRRKKKIEPTASSPVSSTESPGSGTPQSA